MSQPEAAAAGVWADHHHQQQHMASTEVNAFEPLPDSPTGVRTTAGRSLDQQRNSQEVKQQLAGEMIAKLSPQPMPVAQMQHKVTSLLHMQHLTIPAALRFCSSATGRKIDGELVQMTHCHCLISLLVAMQAAATQGPFPGTAHVHLIGETTGAVGLGLGPLYCTWQLVYDTLLWSIAAGQDKVRLYAWQATNL
jgi:hypothetical protein